jgi:CRISPR system Cascade subunit CasB
VARSGNLGDHLACTIATDADRAAVERRFVALLKAHPDDLAGQLRQAISFLKAKEVPVNWSQLLLDMCAWDHPQRYVQRRWATAFWGATAKSVDSQEDRE